MKNIGKKNTSIHGRISDEEAAMGTESAEHDDNATDTMMPCCDASGTIMFWGTRALINEVFNDDNVAAGRRIYQATTKDENK